MPDATAWPSSLFAAPILRGLDSAGRRAVENAGRLRQLAPGERVFAIDELGDSFFVVERGEIELRARTRDAIDEFVRLRVARPGETFGDLSLGFSAAAPEGWSGFLRGNYQFSDDYEAWSGNAGLRYAWQIPTRHGRAPTRPSSLSDTQLFG